MAQRDQNLHHQSRTQLLHSVIRRRPLKSHAEIGLQVRENHLHLRRVQRFIPCFLRANECPFGLGRSPWFIRRRKPPNSDQPVQRVRPIQPKRNDLGWDLPVIYQKCSEKSSHRFHYESQQRWVQELNRLFPSHFQPMCHRLVRRLARLGPVWNCSKFDQHWSRFERASCEQLCADSSVDLRDKLRA